MNDTTAVISTLPAKAAQMLAVEILLADPKALGDDVLESCLYILRERLQGVEIEAETGSCTSVATSATADSWLAVGELGQGVEPLRGG